MKTSMLKSVGAVFAGFVAINILSGDTDQMLHTLEVYLPWGEPMYDTGLNFLALAYRIAYAIIGSYIAVSLTPNAPMRHALTLGGAGVVLSTAGAIAMWDMSPNWFPVALVLIALPCAWLGGKLYEMRLCSKSPR